MRERRQVTLAILDVSALRMAERSLVFGRLRLNLMVSRIEMVLAFPHNMHPFGSVFLWEIRQAR